MSKLTQYWLDLCDSDLKAAKLLLKGKLYLQCGYFCHQVVEKSFKAVIAHNEKTTPPKIHDLGKLATKAKIWDSLPKSMRKFIDDLEPLQIRGRYPEERTIIASTLTYKRCDYFVKGTEEILCWIKERLGKSPSNLPKQ